MAAAEKPHTWPTAERLEAVSEQLSNAQEQLELLRMAYQGLFNNDDDDGSIPAPGAEIPSAEDIVALATLCEHTKLTLLMMTDELDVLKKMRADSVYLYGNTRER